MFKVETTTWSHRLKGMSWRIDTHSRARHIDQLNSVSALVELQISDPQKPEEEVTITKLNKINNHF